MAASGTLWSGPKPSAFSSLAGNERMSLEAYGMPPGWDVAWMTMGSHHLVTLCPHAR